MRHVHNRQVSGYERQKKMEAEKGKAGKEQTVIKLTHSQFMKRKQSGHVWLIYYNDVKLVVQRNFKVIDTGETNYAPSRALAGVVLVFTLEIAS
jgi:hypothetical protein